MVVRSNGLQMGLKLVDVDVQICSRIELNDLTICYQQGDRFSTISVPKIGNGLTQLVEPDEDYGGQTFRACRATGG
jgi:hypothetical protein